MPITLRTESGQQVLHAATSRLGRNPDCEMYLPGGSESVVSWEHARLEVKDGRVFLTDLGSTNGTYLNGVKLDGVRRVSAGDRIRFGLKGPELVVVAIDFPPVAVVVPPPPPPPRVVSPPPPAENPFPPGRAETYPPPRPRPQPRPDQPTHTQMYRLVQAVRGQGRTATTVAVAGVSVCLLAVGLFVGFNYLYPTTQSTTVIIPAPAPPPPPPSETERYDRLMKSAVWVETVKKIGDKYYIGRGSGCLIQSGPDRYVLTASHVIAKGIKFQVAFPRRKTDGSDWEYDPQSYEKNNWLIPADVVRDDPSIDLALLKLKSIPDGVVPLKLAAGSPKVGAACYTIGNQAPKGEEAPALWAFKKGQVAQIDYKQYDVGTFGRISAWMIQTDIIINQGDSGGALVNDEDAVIGVNSNGSLDEKGNIYKFQIEWRVIEAFIAGKPIPGKS